MQRRPLQSRALRSAGYDESDETLELEFRSGHVYRYRDVPASLYAWLLRAKNQGRYVAYHLAGRYGEERVAPDAAEEEALVDRLWASLSAEARGTPPESTPPESTASWDPASRDAAASDEDADGPMPPGADA